MRPAAAAVGALCMPDAPRGHGLQRIDAAAAKEYARRTRFFAVKGIGMKASWNGVVIAESDDTVVVEGNHYFPESSLKREYITFSNTHTTCAWKGEASYYSLLVDGAMNADAVWYYPNPKPEAQQVKGRVAFWKGVKVEP
jgi:uncharacterized protein (DUF427 family)